MRTALALIAVLAACGGPVMSRGEAVARARTVTSLTGWKVYWVDADNLESIGHPEFVGYTDIPQQSIWVSTRDPSILIHEAVHVKTMTDQHCEWSQLYLDLHERLEVVGSFRDECRNVFCESDGGGHGWACR